MPWVAREVPEGSHRYRAVNEPAKPRSPREAPQFTCSICNRLIGRRRTVGLLTDGRVACLSCIDRGDLYDQMDCMGTRAAVAHKLGIWP